VCLLELLRLAIYRSFVTTGAAPSIGELAREFDDVERGLRDLADAHAIVLAAGSTEIEMAHPFSGVPTRYRVSSGGVGYFANCAWDALGIAAILGRDTECVRDVDLGVRSGVANGRGVIHFLVPPRRFWDDVRFT
jgi:Alkylmercury lyase